MSVKIAGLMTMKIDTGRVGTFSTGGVKLCVALPGDDMVAFR